jgi:hypothetical protein
LSEALLLRWTLINLIYNMSGIIGKKSRNDQPVQC